MQTDGGEHMAHVKQLVGQTLWSWLTRLLNPQDADDWPAVDPAWSPRGGAGAEMPPTPSSIFQ